MRLVFASMVVAGFTGAAVTEAAVGNYRLAIIAVLLGIANGMILF